MQHIRFLDNAVGLKPVNTRIPVTENSDIDLKHLQKTKSWKWWAEQNETKHLSDV